MNRYKHTNMNKILLFVTVILLAACKEKFISPAPRTATGYLVVEGVVNSDGDGTQIQLSRSTTLDSTGKVIETGAAVYLEANNNLQFPLQEITGGTYGIDNLHLDTTLTYRLMIRTNNAEEYSSDFVKVINNPAIDSISWERNEHGVELFVNTHDPTNQAKYFQWQFEETWEFLSPKPPSLKWVPIEGPMSNGPVTVTYRTALDPQISRCWQFNSSTNIITGSSIKLADDIIHLPFQKIPGASQKLSVLYSVLLKQYTWSKEGYDFLERMRKNTETLGSVFDAQPSELNGNIHCTSNAAQRVIGFFNVSAIREIRAFIYNRDLPGWNYTTNCNEIVVNNNTADIKLKANGTLPTSVVTTSGFGTIASFNVASPECVDCTLTGTNIKPVYWP